MENIINEETREIMREQTRLGKLAKYYSYAALQEIIRKRKKQAKV